VPVKLDSLIGPRVPPGDPPAEALAA